LYGSLIVYFEPMANLTTRVIGTNVQLMSGLPHILLSASSGDTVVFDIPYVSNKRAVDLLDTTPAVMGRVATHVLNPLIDMSGTGSNASVMITAQFLEPELFYPHDNVGSGLYHATSRKEAGNKARNKDIASLNANKTVQSGINSLQLASNYISAVTEVAAPIFDIIAMLGLSKPKTVDKTAVSKIDPFHDINTGDGVDACLTIGYDPNNQITTTPNVGGISVDEMAFSQLCGTPVLTAIIPFTAASVTPVTITTTSFGLNPTFGTDCNYADWLAQNFRFVSGSKKVKIYIRASLYHSARLVFYLSDTTITANWMNCYHRIVDVQGDTEVEFTLPYSEVEVAQSTLASQSFSLYAYVLSWSQTDFAVVAPIYLDVYTSAASDFKLDGLLDICYTATSCPRNEFAHDFEAFHPSVTGYSTTNLLFGEQYNTLRQVVHRYQPIQPKNSTVANVTSVYPGTGNVATGVYTGLCKFGLLYRFYRGSLRFKFVHRTSSVRNSNIFVQDGVSVYSYAGTVISSTTNPVNEIEVPYYSQRLMQDTSTNDVRTLVGGDVTYVMSAAGDDFSFSFIHPPPAGNFTPSPASGGNVFSGNLGLQNFLDSVF